MVLIRARRRLRRLHGGQHQFVLIPLSITGEENAALTTDGY